MEQHMSTPAPVNKFNCPACTASYKIEDSEFGQKLRCEKCGKAFMVHDASSQAQLIPEPQTTDDSKPSPTSPPVSTQPQTTSTQEPLQAPGSLLYYGLSKPAWTVILLLVLITSGLISFLYEIKSNRQQQPVAIQTVDQPATPGSNISQDTPTNNVADSGNIPGNTNDFIAPPSSIMLSGDTTDMPPFQVTGDNSDTNIPPDGDSTNLITGTLPPTDDSGKPAEVKSGTMEDDLLAKSAADESNRYAYVYTDLTKAGRNINGDRLAGFLKILENNKFDFSRNVREAFFKFQKEQTLDDLKETGKTIPADFLKWINDDPVISATVYGAKPRPANVMLALYSLQLDVGRDTIKKCTQLALAAAVLTESNGPTQNIFDRAPIKLEIPTCPLKPVDTRDKKRELDLNDHIINFLNEDYRLNTKSGTKKTPNPHHESDSCVKAFHFKKGTLPELKGLIASDVIHDDNLKDMLSEYLKTKGTPIEIPHGLVQSPATYINFETFHKAYTEKGLLPAERDPMPTTAERLLYLARNADRSPFPLTRAPWPITMLLFEVSQPLRESEEIWTEYCRNKRFITYGNYVGPIAQNSIYLAATDLRPFPFSCKNRSWQAMIKNGGVCGTMAAIAVGTYSALGIPACTAGQPGHCALISYTPSGRNYIANIEQSVTGGPLETTAHAQWHYGDGRYGSNMYVYRESIASAINVGFERYLNSCILYSIYRLLPDDVREKHGFEILQSGLDLNPYNIMLVDALAEVGTPIQHANIYRRFMNIPSAAHKAGHGMSEAYRDRVCHVVFNRIASLPVTESQDEAKTVYKALAAMRFDPKELDNIDNLEKITLNYHLAALHTKAFLDELTAEFVAYFETSKQKYPAACQQKAKRIQVVADMIKDEEEKKKWLQKLAARKHNRENYSALGRLQIDTFDKDSGKPLNFMPGPGGLTIKDGLGSTKKVHFVLGSGLDGYEKLRSIPDPNAPKSDKPFKPPFASIVFRDDAADLIDKLLGAPKKEYRGVSAMLTDDVFKDKKKSAEILEFLEKSKFEDPKIIQRYTMAAEGEDKFLAKELEDFKKYVSGSGRNPLLSRNMATNITTTAAMVSDKQKKTEWLKKMQKIIAGKESYASRRCFETLDPYGQELPPEKQVTLMACKATNYIDDASVAINSLLNPDTATPPPAAAKSTPPKKTPPARKKR